jgi:glutamate--cysteine ligase
VPAPYPTLTFADVARFVDERVFAPHDPGRVGIELEWFTRVAGDGSVPDPEFLRALLPDPLPGGSRITFEPGGQLELSGPPLASATDACAAMAVDETVVQVTLADAGIDLTAIGLDDRGRRPRVVDAPRYRAMERYFDAQWPRGRVMMRNTASTQINVEVGDRETRAARWQLAHDLGPVLAATFANSPFDGDGRPTGRCSNRLAVWDSIDRRRTAPAADLAADPVTAWTRYLLAAPVMMIRVDTTASEAICVPLPFERWIAEGHELGWPTLDDLEYHTTTLFPPVRPRGWLELRMLDALPRDVWPVAVAVTAALLDDPDAAERASDAVRPVRRAWATAGRAGVTDPVVRAAALQCFAAAIDALERSATADGLLTAVDDYRGRYVAAGRCPADDRLAERAALRAATA